MYRNSETGQEKEYVSPDYPYDDSIWMSQWEFVSQRVVDPNPKITDIMLDDATKVMGKGNDMNVQDIAEITAERL